MATTIKIRGGTARGERFGGGLAGSMALHGAIAAALIAWAYYTPQGQSWGSATGKNGAIEAAMVDAIPLPARQPMDTNNVLATEAPSPAPVEAKQKTVEAPKPDAVEIEAKKPKPAPVAKKETPAPPKNPQIPKPQPDKAQTGEAPGLRVAMSTAQTRVGTFSVGVADATFGAKFAYYNDQIREKLAEQWITGMLDAQAAGRRVYLTFQVGRDGSPSHVRIEQSSGDATLDQTALAAVQRVDTFGPLPDGYTGS